MMDKLYFERPANVQSLVSEQALARWDPSLRASDSEQDNVINILDPIGYDPWTGGGTTARRISAALKSIGKGKEVVVNINSPGGDFFEGLGIYSLLRQHEGNVTTRVLGLAASAASVIAMAGDLRLISEVGFFMIHNVWTIGIGNRNDFRELADTLEEFDGTMADMYSTRASLDRKDVIAMLDKETWLNATNSVDKGFANDLFAEETLEHDSASNKARAAVTRMDLALAKSGLTRSERRALIQDLKGMPSAAHDDKPSAVIAQPLRFNFDFEVFKNGRQ